MLRQMMLVVVLKHLLSVTGAELAVEALKVALKVHIDSMLIEQVDIGERGHTGGTEDTAPVLDRSMFQLNVIVQCSLVVE